MSQKLVIEMSLRIEPKSYKTFIDIQTSAKQSLRERLVPNNVRSNQDEWVVALKVPIKDVYAESES